MIITALRIDGNQRYLDQEQAIAVRELDATAHLAPQHDQLLPERGIFRFKSAGRLEQRSQKPQQEA
jgi:hypothetical protein